MTTMTEVRILHNIAGGRCQLSLIRDLLHHGTPLEVLYEAGAWKRIAQIVPRIQNEPAPADGTRYLMTDDGIACRVGPSESVFVRVPPEARKAGETP